MAIQIQCPGCKAVLQVEEALAGKQGRCIHCGHRLTVPASGNALVLSGSPPLSEASPEAMVRELYQRNKSALLVVFEPSASGSYSLTEAADESLKCIVTEDISQGRFAQLLDSIGRRFGGKKKGQITVSLSQEDQPYELKGDRLGMGLDEFRQKYARGAEGSPQRLPLCSDEAWGASRATLRSEPWHRSAGIVHARVDLPAENNSPTIAGVKTELLLYQFVEGRLFRISAYFPTDQFHEVSEALVHKCGPPSRESNHPRQLEWENRVSSIVLSRGLVHPPEASTLHFIHKDLVRVAESRVPKGAEDI